MGTERSEHHATVALHQGLSRRTFLQAVATGVSFLAVQACTPAGQAPVATTGDAAALSSEAGELSVIYWADSNDAFQNVINAFQAETGNTINYEVAPAGYLDWQQLMTTRFASGDTTTDAFHCDDFQAAIYGAAGWLTPLEPTIEQYDIDLADWPQTLLTDVSSWEGTLYRLPWGNDTEIFLYRTDFFEEAGVQPPTTWAQLVEVAQQLTQGEERYGIALSAQKNGVLGNDIQHWANQAGGAINRLDHPGSRDAIVFYKDLFATHKVAPPSTPQEDYTSVLQGFLDNKYAMWWVWDGFYGAFRNNEDFWNDQVSAFLPPRGPENAQTVTGCWGWAISGASQKQELASEWVGFTARPEIMKMQILRGRVPARISLWADPEVQEQAPSAPFLQQLADAGDLVKARPVTPSIQEIYDAAEQNIHAYLTDQVDIDQAINNAMDKINPILERDLQ
jgi:multiple sugar transport system substrate-binding protein